MDIKEREVRPRIIIHGGAGNITRDNLSREAYESYKYAMLTILHMAEAMLYSPNGAIDAASFAVMMLENNELFNSGHGAVYTAAGTHELEASIMVSSGYRKRGVGVMNVRRTQNPILLAKEMLLRGQSVDGGGAQGHCQLQGDVCDSLAREWGLEMVSPSYFWTRKRWDEHRIGLGLSHTDEEYYRAKANADTVVRDHERDTLIEHTDVRSDEQAQSQSDDPSWDSKEYLPQGTVGAVALDSRGVICVCTSTGGLTNKLPGRIGDTPTIGAGFFAEEWFSSAGSLSTVGSPSAAPSILNMIMDCLPNIFDKPPALHVKAKPRIRAVGMSGTGNGDSFLRLCAVRTAAAITRFSGHASLQEAVTAVAGPEGMLQRSAEDRWKRTGEGEGGIIGIELVQGKGIIVQDFNCGGMFRAWMDDHSGPKFLAFREEY